MEKQSDDLADDIHAAKDDWEAKKRDDSVPGARAKPGEPLGDGEPEATGEGAPEVEDEHS